MLHVSYPGTGTLKSGIVSYYIAISLLLEIVLAIVFVLLLVLTTLVKQC